jgi:predicted transcriptional regulator
VYTDVQVKTDRGEFHTLTVRVPNQLHTKIDQIASETGETVSAIVRAMLRSGVEHRNGEQAVGGVR